MAINFGIGSTPAPGTVPMPGTPGGPGGPGRVGAPTRPLPGTPGYDGSKDTHANKPSFGTDNLSLSSSASSGMDLWKMGAMQLEAAKGAAAGGRPLPGMPGYDASKDEHVNGTAASTASGSSSSSSSSSSSDSRPLPGQPGYDASKDEHVNGGRPLPGQPGYDASKDEHVNGSSSSSSTNGSDANQAALLEAAVQQWLAALNNQLSA